MRINNLAQAIVDEDDFVDIMYAGSKCHTIIVDDCKWVEQYNNAADLFEFDQIHWEQETIATRDEYAAQCLDDWNLPEEYTNFDISEYLLSKCTDQAAKDRVASELDEYNKHNMHNVLIFVKYFVDTLTDHGIVWGVGRGSSVASYVLFLLGLHRVDSLKYDLDIHEFLKGSL
jgi:DNA polymerase III alpha subunit